MGFTPQSQGGTHIVERNLTRVTVVFSVLFFATPSSACSNSFAQARRGAGQRLH